MTLSLAPAKHQACCLRSLPRASIRTVFSPNIVIHWRFSETDCMVGRVEVSPKARKRGVRGRVVEIGANRQPCEPSVTPVSYTHLRAHETRHELVCRLLL